MFQKLELKSFCDYPVYINGVDNIKHKYLKVKNIYVYLLVFYRKKKKKFVDCYFSPVGKFIQISCLVYYYIKICKY